MITPGTRGVVKRGKKKGRTHEQDRCPSGAARSPAREPHLPSGATEVPTYSLDAVELAARVYLSVTGGADADERDRPYLVCKAVVRAEKFLGVFPMSDGFRSRICRAIEFDMPPDKRQ